MGRFTYTRFRPEQADAVDLQALLDQLADYLLQSGFAGGPVQDPWWGEFGEDDPEHTLDALKRAILEALYESGQFTPEMLEALRGEDDEEGSEQLASFLDAIVKRLIDEGYLQRPDPTSPESGPGSVTGPADPARTAARQVEFTLTGKGLDFLAYRTLRSMLGALGKSSFGSHETPHLSTGVESESGSKEYEFGDVLNLDVNATLTHALRRRGTLDFPLELEYEDLMVRQSEYRSSCATVLMLDCSHSMILYGEDRFTPAKKVALALTHLIRTQFPGDTMRVVLFHDSAEELPIARLAHAQVGPYHTNTAAGLKLARRLLLSQRKDMRQIIMITDGKPSALTLPDGQIYKNPMGLDLHVVGETLREVAECRRSGIVINTFMLARDPALVSFVQEVCRIARGKAYFTSTLSLGEYVLMDFMRKRTRRG